MRGKRFFCHRLLMASACLSWALAAILGRHCLGLLGASDVALAVAGACSTVLAAGLWRHIRRAEREGAVTWIGSAAMARRVSDLERQLAECTARLNDYDTALSIIGAGMMGRSRPKGRFLHVVSDTADAG